jgi:hypothetical protein
MFRPLGRLQVDSKIVGGKYHTQPFCVTYQQLGGGRDLVLQQFVGVCLCEFNMINRAGYSRVFSWSISMASSESAVWSRLEHVGWSIRVLGPHGFVAVE